MDLVSASSERLQPLPQYPSQPLPSPSDDATWLEAVTEKAKRGVAEAQFALGQYLYAKGQYRDAVQQFEIAADRGYMQAKYQLGVMFYDGKGVDEDSVSGGARPLCPISLHGLQSVQRISFHDGSRGECNTQGCPSRSQCAIQHRPGFFPRFWCEAVGRRGSKMVD